MSNIKIHVNNVSKSYKKYKSEFHRFLSWFGIKTLLVEEINVLNNINFSISEGEAVGLVGENGAGKSTLLKIITGTIQPTIGRVAVDGRISAILELGLGFNPEMTGKQNVYLSAGVMGFRENEIDKLVEDILGFSELGDYFNKPVRTYSSGMQMRLAFSIATAIRPEVLIIDEALSVGDTYFQHKSFNRIKEFREQGTTLLFVSHDRGAVQALCNRAILLEKGNMIKDGKPEEVMDFYNALIAEKENSTVAVTELANGKVKTTSGTGEARVVNIALLNTDNEKVEHINVGQQVTLEVHVDVHADIECLVFGYGIKDRLGQVMYGTNTFLKNMVQKNVKNGTEFKFKISFSMNLGPGSYSIQTALCSSDSHLENNYEWQDNSHIFHVVNIEKEYFAGCTWLDPEITIGKIYQ